MVSLRNIDIKYEIAHHAYMRTTLNLDDDVLRQVRSYAESRDVPVGRAVSELVRKGLSVPTPIKSVNGIQVFDIPSDSARVTSTRVKELESELE
jgi:hypothetical protein